MTQAINRGKRFSITTRVIVLGVLLNVALMAAKLLVAAWSGSAALRADGMESGCDLLVALVMLWAARLSRKPYDPCHPYGHGKIESLVALLVGLAIMGTGVWILIDAGHAIFHHRLPEVHWLAALVAVAVVAVKEAAARFTSRRARVLGSPLLSALAQDHHKDAMTSVATAIGAGAAAAGFLFFDPAIAAFTALLVLRAGAETFKRAFDELVDAALPQEEIAAISRDALAVEGVEHVHEIRGRRSGQFLIIDLKLEMDPQMTVQRSHDVAEKVKRRVFRNHPAVGDVMIHVNPHDDGRHHDLIRL